MSRDRILTVHEHDILYNGNQLESHEFAELVRYHKKVQGKYYELGYDSIKLKHHVGIIRVGTLTIEILPKIDRSDNGTDRGLWRTALVEMLSVSRLVKLDVLASAPQLLGKSHLLEIMMHQFIQECENLVREGLVRKYRSHESNVNTLKGKLLFSKHLSKNLTRPDKWYTRHTVFDHQHALHGILRTVTDLLYTVAPGALKTRLSTLKLYLADILPFIPDTAFMDSLHYDRRTERYRQSIDLAWLILQDLSIALSGGKSLVFSIMFDMNKLFEHTVLNLLQQEVRNRSDSVAVACKESRGFWKSMYLQPDIIIRKNKRTVIVDTKWKVCTGLPDEDNLRQVFAYGLYFGAEKVVLLYPGREKVDGYKTSFYAIPGHEDIELECMLGYADLVCSDGRLNKNFARHFLDAQFCN